MNKKPFYIYGDGEQTRAFSYIDDFTPYMMKVGLQEKWDGEIFNIGPREECTVNRLADVVLKHYFGNRKKVPKRLEPKYLPFRPKEVKHAYCTMDKAERLLGYKTTVPFEQGLRQMVEWAKSVGPQKFQYSELEIVNNATPETWRKKLI